MQGQILSGRYQIISYLGGGGFGQTYLAYDSQLPGKPQCVVKQLQPQSTDPAIVEMARRLFDTEAQLLYKLGNHPQIPRLLAHFEERQEFYLVQEFIEGNDLTLEVTPGNVLGEAQVVCLLRDILEVLAFVHQQNIIHRDIKLTNIRRRYDGKIVLIDFGVAKQISTQLLHVHGMTNVTVKIGTPGYMPSEQAQGKPRLSSDVYAVGTIAIGALTGIAAHQLPDDPITGEISWRDRARVSPELADILDKMVRYDFRDRYPSAMDALQAIADTGLISSCQVIPVFSAVPTVSSEPTPTVADFPKLAVADGRELKEEGNTAAPQLRRDRSNFGVSAQSNAERQELPSTLGKNLAAAPDYVKTWAQKIDTLYNLLFESKTELGKQTPDVHLNNLPPTELQQFQKAAAGLDELIQIQLRNHAAWYSRGDALLTLNRYEEAIAAYNKAIKIEPQAVGGWSSRVEKLQELQRTQDAIKLCNQIASELEQKVAQLLPHDDAFWNRIYLSWYRLGNCLQKMQCYQQAAVAYEQAISIHPNDSDAWYFRGTVLEQLQRYHEAIICYDRAISIKEDFQLAIESRQRVRALANAEGNKNQQSNQ